MGSAALAPALAPDPAPVRGDIQSKESAEETVEPDTTKTPATGVAADVDRVQSGVLQALADSNQRILVSMLSEGEWSMQGNELVIKVAESQTVVDMSLSADAKRLAIAAASGVLGRAMKLKVVPGAAVAPQEKSNGASRAPMVGGRGRAEQDPVVRRMQEKDRKSVV